MISARHLRLLAALVFSTLFTLGCSVNEQLQGYLGSINNKPTLTLSSAPATEGSDLIVTFTVSKVLTADLVINYSTGAGTATDVSDFTSTAGSVTITNGQTTAQMTIITALDTVYEGAETLAVSVTVPSEVSGASSYMATIADDDTPPTISFSTGANSIMEDSATPIDIVINIAGSFERNQVVSYNKVNGTAVDADYTLVAGTVTFASTDTSKTITLTPVNDTDQESDETLSVNLSAPVGGATLLAPTSHVVTILDDDSVPRFNFTTASSTVKEGVATANIVLNLSRADTVETKVDYAVTGTATGAGTDYTLSNGTVTFAIGDTSKTISVGIANDATPESAETVILTLSNAQGGLSQLGSTLIHTLTIYDNEHVWTGASGDGLWSTAANWLTGALPANTESVNFDNSCGGFNCNATVDVAVAGIDLTLAATYTGTISVQNTFNLNSFSMGAGTLNILASTYFGDFTQSGGTINFTGTAGFESVRFQGTSLTVTGGTANFTPDIETIYFVGFPTLTINAPTWDINGGMILAQAPFTIIGTLTATCELRLVSFSGTMNGGEFIAKGKVSAAPWNGGTASITLTGTADQQFGENVIGSLPDGKITVNKSSGKVYQSGAVGLSGAGQDLEILSGTWDMAGYNLTVNDRLDMSAGTKLYKNCATLTHPATGTILGDIYDGTAGVNLSIATPAAVTEGAAQSFVISQSPANCVATTFEYATSNATAIEPGDYTAVAATWATIPAAGTSLTVTINSQNDSLNESSEYYTVGLSNILAGVSSGTIVANGVIDDDGDVAPTITVASDTKYEGSPLNFVVSLSGASGLPVVFDYATSDNTAVASSGDYTATSGVATIAVGDTSITVNVPTLLDYTIESSETLTFAISNLQGATAGAALSQSGTIQEGGITLSNLVISNVTADAFDVSVNYTDDNDNNATVTAYYCSVSDNPVCRPEDGGSLVLTRGAGVFTGSVAGLVVPYDAGDVLAILVKAVDAGGTVGSPQFALTTLLMPNVVVSNLVIDQIFNESFRVRVDAIGDSNNNATATLYYCDQADHGAGCDPQSYASATMYRVQKTFALVTPHLAAPYNPGDTLNVRVVVNDGDGVVGSPFNSTVTLTNDPMGPLGGAVTSIEIQPDGKRIIAGDFTSWGQSSRNMGIVGRLTLDGGYDTSFALSVSPTGVANSVNKMLFLPGNKILMVGNFTAVNGVAKNFIVRLNANGSIDNTFNVGSGTDALIESAEVQSDGKILIAGNFTLYNGQSASRIARLNTDGTLDTTFVTGLGFDASTILALQGDGKIIVTGNFASYNGTPEPKIIRLNSDGTKDTSFVVVGTGPNIGASALAIGKTGEIYLVGGFSTFSGSSYPRIISLTNTGAINSSFDIGAGFNNSLYAIKVQLDGKIIVGGGTGLTYKGVPTASILRINQDGSLDTTFAPASNYSSINEIEILSDGRIFAAVSPSIIGGDYFVLFDKVGQVVSSFDLFRRKAYSGGWYVAVNADGAVYVSGGAGYNSKEIGHIARINTDGSLDSGFNVGSGFSAPLLDVALASSGKLYVSGYYSMYKGTFTTSALRLNADASIDTTFNVYTGSGWPSSICVQSDNKPIYVGGFTWYTTDWVKGIQRALSTTGADDTSYLTGYGFNSHFSAFNCFMQSDDKLMAVGSFTSYRGQTGINGIVRINSNGTQDNNFMYGPVSEVNRIIQLPDGKYIIGGGFTAYAGIGRLGLARINNDGTLDRTFNEPVLGSSVGVDVGGPNYNGVYALAALPDGRIVIGGRFSTYRGVTRGNIALVLSDGSLDTTFDFGTGFNDSIRDIKLINPNTFAVGGYFTEFNGTPMSYYKEFKFNDTSISNLAITGVTNTGFTGAINYFGDGDNDSSAALYYCNNTDSPGCNPTTGTNIAMAKSGATWTAAVTGLTSPNDAGDQLRVRVVVTDPEGILGSPLDTTVRLQPVISISDVTVSEGQYARPVVSLNVASTQNIIFNYVTDSGTAAWYTDYAPTAGTYTIPAGQTSVTLPEIRTEWDYAETSEYFNVTLSNLVNVAAGDIVGVVNIVDETDGLFLDGMRIFDLRSNGFSVNVPFSGDANANGAVTLWYCNHTDSPGCNPQSGASIGMTRGASSYSVNVSGLSAPNNVGDTLNLRIVATDTGGFMGAPQDGVATLTNNSDVVVLDMLVSEITSTGFMVAADYILDSNANSTATLWYCNETDSPGCDPEISGVSVPMTRATGAFTIAVTGLATPNDPGDSINLRMVTVDTDGVVGSPQNKTITLLPSAIPNYRSVGPGNTSPLATGAANSLTIAGSTATFAVGLPERVGVGDVIQYDSDSDGDIDARDGLVFIHGRTSATVFTVKRFDGSEPKPVVGDNDWSMYRAYTALNTALRQVENTGIDIDLRNFDITATTKNLVANNWQMNFAMYGDAPDQTNYTGTSMYVTGWTTSATNYIRIYTPTNANEVGISQRHSGRWSETAYRLVQNTDPQSTLGVIDANVRVDGIQIHLMRASFGTETMLWAMGANFWLSNSILRSVNSYSNFEDLVTITGTNYKVWNNVMFNSLGDDVVSLGGAGGSFYNNTVIVNNTYKLQRGISVWAGGAHLLKNNLVYVTGFASNVGYVDAGGLDANSTNNASSDGSAPGLAARINQTFNFVDIAGGDYRLMASDTAAKNQGVDLSADAALSFTSDGGGVPRPQGGTWDIGFSEVPGTIFTDDDHSNSEFDSGIKTNIDWNTENYLEMAKVPTSEVTSAPDPLGFDMTANKIIAHFNEATYNNANTVIVDSSGNGLNGTLSTGSAATNLAVSGKLNGAIDLKATGAGEYINFGSAATLDDLPAVSMSFWLDTDTMGGNTWGVLAKKGAGASPGISTGWVLGSASFGYKTLKFEAKFSTTNLYVATAERLPGAWTHVVLTWDGTADANGVKIYFDGREVSEFLLKTNGVGTYVSDASDNLLLGSDQGGSHWDGRIDEFLLFGRVLSEVEVSSLYSRQRYKYDNVAPATFTSRVMDSLGVGTIWHDLILKTRAPYGYSQPLFGNESVVHPDSINSSNIRFYWPLDRGKYFHGDNELRSLGFSSDTNYDVVNTSEGTTVNKATGGKFGGAMYFDGVNDYMTLYDEAGFNQNAATSTSWSAWIKPTSIQNGFNTIFMTSNSANIQEFSIALSGAESSQYCFSKNAVVVQIIYSSTRYIKTCTARDTITVGQWQHLAVTYDSAGTVERERIRIYVNGRDVTDDNGTEFNSSIVGQTFSPTIEYFGAGYNGLSRGEFYHGVLDDFTVWNGVLTPVQAESLYARGATNITYQVRSCALSNCTDGTFVGYDGLSSSFFSPLINGIKALMGIPLGQPQTNQYFQYTFTLESESRDVSPKVTEVHVRGY